MKSSQRRGSTKPQAPRQKAPQQKAPASKKKARKPNRKYFMEIVILLSGLLFLSAFGDFQDISKRETIILEILQVFLAIRIFCLAISQQRKIDKMHSKSHEKLLDNNVKLLENKRKLQMANQNLKVQNAHLDSTVKHLRQAIKSLQEEKEAIAQKPKIKKGP